MTIIVCPLSQAPDVARTHKPSHAVSLLDPGSMFPVLVGFPEERHFRLCVHDINEARDGCLICDDTQMRTILDFVGGWDRDAPMLIHCYAGISRSTATAYITACLHNPAADEHEIALALREASPAAWPNRRFVALADTALGRSGRMSRAIEAIGEGHSWLDIGENAPFMLPSHFEPKR
jgi:predicted protein tyrosine phosphatase